MINKLKGSARPLRDDVAHISLAVLALIGLWIFCWAARYPLIIPLFLLFLAIHPDRFTQIQS